MVFPVCYSDFLHKSLQLQEQESQDTKSGSFQCLKKVGLESGHTITSVILFVKAGTEPTQIPE